MRVAFLIIALLLLLTPLESLAQRDRKTEDAQKLDIINDRIELIVESMTDEDIDLTTLFDDLEYFYDRPLNLNFASAEELRRLMILNEVQINNLLAHIEKHGKLISMYELQSIAGFTVEDIRAIEPFVKVTSNFESPSISMKDLFANGKNELYLRYIRTLEEQAGSSDISPEELEEKPNSRYLGNADRYYMRYRFKFNNNVSWGITGEKDAGEEFFKGSQPNGFDFYSAHFYLYNIGKLKHLAIGDYQIQLGQGLTMWSGRATRKSALDAVNVKRSARTIRPYTSVDENNFMRGGAATFALGNWELTGFYSRNGRDGNIAIADTLDSEEEITISSFQTSGFHRTPSELEDKDALVINTFGSNFNYKGKRLTAGITGVGSVANANFEPSTQIYSQFAVATGQFFKVGADYNYVWRNLNFFGEVSGSDNGGFATINGVLASLDPRFSLTMVHRHYGRSYLTLASNALAESGFNNESGVYFGFEAKPIKKWTISGYYDKFRFPWLRYQANAPSDGVDWLTELTYKPSKKFIAYVRYRQEIKRTNFRGREPAIDYLVDRDRRGLRFNMVYKVSETIRLRTRLEMAFYQEGALPTEQGYLIFQDVRYKALSSPLSLDLRFALFQSDSYDSRIYAYENDILYVYSIPAFYNRGSRYYITAKYRVARWMDVWLRYSQTYFGNVESIGSGLSEIQGRTRSDIKAQVRFKF